MSRTIPKTIFSTSSVDSQDKIPLWQDTISALFSIDLPPEVKYFDSETRVDSYLIGGLMMSNCHSFRQSFSRGTKEIVQSGMDHFLVQLYVSGTNQILLDDSCLNVHPGDIQVLDLLQVHKAQIASDGHNASYQFENLNLFIPRFQLEALIPNAEQLHNRVFRSGSVVNEVIKSHMLTLFGNAAGMSTEEAQVVTQPTIELIASLLVCNQHMNDMHRRGADSAKVIQVIKVIDKHLNSQLSPDFIAAAVGVSRTYLYRLCESWGGVMNLVKCRRLKLAFNLLKSRPQSQVQEIAYLSGFSSNQLFSRSFKEHFGLLPTEVKMSANDFHVPQNFVVPDENTRFVDWMKSLSA